MQNINKVKNLKKTPTWIVVHYTGIANASSKSCTKSYTKIKNAVSTHFFCDSKEVWRVVDEEHIAWQCGNGQVVQPKKDKTLSLKEIAQYGDVSDWRYKLAAENHIRWKQNGDDFQGNSESFGVDICTTKTNTKSNSVKDEDWDFNEKAVDNAAKVVAYLCLKYNISINNVIRHCDATGKPCLPVDKTEILTPDGFKKNI
jgi:N-acetylmuramoyl-L-alanine amidase CwlA